MAFANASIPAEVTYTEAVSALQKDGEKITWGEDFSKSQEHILAETFGRLFFIKEWPATKARAFFATPNRKILHMQCLRFLVLWSGYSPLALNAYIFQSS